MQIPEDKVTRTYELTCLIPVGYTKTELDEIKQKIEDTLEKFDAEIEKKEDWGKKETAYTIKREGKHHDEVYYLHGQFTSEPSHIESIRLKLKLNEDVLRELLVTAEE